MVVEQLTEAELAGPIPRFEVPGWRERLGVVAGVTGRGYDLGLWTDQPVGEVMTRWRALRRVEAGFPATVLGNQIHGRTVLWHEHGAGWVQVEGVDGHATATPGILLTVTIADCIPVYLVDPVHKAIALLHSGWRGTSEAILRAGLKRLVEGAGTRPADVVMHCGVGICGKCYEVGSEVPLACGLPAEGSGPWHVDLRQVLADQARALGIGTVSTSTWCSAHHRNHFYSHRASGGRDGRMVAYLGIPDPHAAEA